MPNALVLVFCFSISVISCCRVLIVVLSLYSFDFYVLGGRCCKDELGTLHAVWINVLCIQRQNLVRMLWPLKIDLTSPPPLPLPHSPHPPISNILLTVPRAYFCCCLLFLSLYVFACISWWIFYFGLPFGHLFLERDCPFGSLLVVFWFSCRCFECVLFSLWCIGTDGVSKCIDSWSLLSFLFFFLKSHLYAAGVIV